MTFHSGDLVRLKSDPNVKGEVISASGRDVVCRFDCKGPVTVWAENLEYGEPLFKVGDRVRLKKHPEVKGTVIYTFTANVNSFIGVQWPWTHYREECSDWEMWKISSVELHESSKNA